jgi:hypothetical protein
MDDVAPLPTLAESCRAIILSPLGVTARAFQAMHAAPDTHLAQRFAATFGGTLHDY